MLYLFVLRQTNPIQISMLSSICSAHMLHVIHDLSGAAAHKSWDRRCTAGPPCLAQEDYIELKKTRILDLRNYEDRDN